MFNIFQNQTENKQKPKQYNQQQYRQPSQQQKRNYLDQFKDEYWESLETVCKYATRFYDNGYKQTDEIICNEWPEKELSLLKICLKDIGFGIKEKGKLIMLFW